MEKKPSILLVEDHPDMLDYLSQTLEMAGYQTVKTNGGFEALRALSNQSIDLILSDIVMSDLGGINCTASCGQLPYWLPSPFFS